MRSGILRYALAAASLAVVAVLFVGDARITSAEKLDPKVAAIEAKRIAAIEKVRPAVVAVFMPGGQGGGSGVLISEDGYALTNFHVVAGLPVSQCGLADGVMYDAVTVGVDKVGDVGLIKLLPKKEGDKFPYAKLGDSDKSKAGDWSIAMGNPFLLAKDFTPTVTFGLISGVHRYQYPEGGLLEYTDCIQIDTSINPGNSGGPLFNMDGELIGINGRGSFDKRFRINSGVGYAISINQIKNFLGHLRAGLEPDHASLGAVVTSEDPEAGSGRLLVRTILENCDARRRGLDIDDELVGFAGRTLTTVNEYKNVLGLYPRGWRLPLVYRHEDENKVVEKRETLVRLMGVLRQVIEEEKDKDKPAGPKPPKPPVPNTPASKFVVEKKGFTNYYFNKLERDRVLDGFHKKYGDFTTAGKKWTVETTDEVKGKKNDGKLEILEKDKQPLVKLKVNGLEYELEPLKTGLSVEVQKDPRNSGGLLMALYHYQQFLTVGEKAFAGGFYHGGVEPFYPPSADGKTDYAKQRVDCEVIRTEAAGVAGRWYFDPKDQKLLGFEITVEDKDDPCEVFLSDYKAVDGKQLPHKMEVVYGNGRYGTINVQSYKFEEQK